MKKTLKCTIEYVGTGFHGWQAQTALRTVQGETEKAFAIILGSPVHIDCAGRTDAGVHALNQVASLKTDSSIQLGRLRYSVNAVLPHDITIKSIEERKSLFHARWSAISRSYEYRIINRLYRSAFEYKRALHYSIPLRTELMAEALSYFIGEHDFSAFCCKNKPLTHYNRTVLDVCLTVDEGDIRIFIKANAFLHNMVRVIAGTLLEVGRGRIDPRHIPVILDSGERSMAGYTAPAHGLYLVDVEYPEGL